MDASDRLRLDSVWGRADAEGRAAEGGGSTYVRTPQKASHFEDARAEAHLAHEDATPKALRALDVLVIILGTLALERLPFAGAAAQVAWR